MGSVFGGGGHKQEPAPLPAAAPAKTDAEVQQAAADERRRFKMRRGRASTILTDPSGGAIMGTSGSSGPTTLLGGG